MAVRGTPHLERAEWMTVLALKETTLDRAISILKRKKLVDYRHFRPQKTSRHLRLFMRPLITKLSGFQESSISPQLSGNQESSPARLSGNAGHSMNEGDEGNEGDETYDLSVVAGAPTRSEEHTSELQSLMRISYAVFCLKKKTHTTKKQL